MPERSEEMIEVELRLALFVSLQRLRKPNEVVQRVLKIVSHLCGSEAIENVLG